MGAVRVSMGITMVGSGVGYSVGGGNGVIVGDGFGVRVGLGEGRGVTAPSEVAVSTSETGGAQPPSAISPTTPISPATSHGIPRPPNRVLTIVRVYLKSGGGLEDGWWMMDVGCWMLDIGW